MDGLYQLIDEWDTKLDYLTHLPKHANKENFWKSLATDYKT